MKALALISGGLDSTLAARLMQQQGIELIAFHAENLFCPCIKLSAGACQQGAAGVSRMLGVPLVTIDVSAEVIERVRKPRFGYGAHVNPCLDCRLVLFKHARQAMGSQGASFIVTGEVLGQRPMSQKRHMLPLLEKEAGLQGLIVRPLCARLLDETIPEKNGWIDRQKLLQINGRSRKEQMALARRLGITAYPNAAGGCLLTDPQFSRRVRDLLEHDELDLDNVLLSKVGRYFRLGERTRLIVGRNERENGQLLVLRRPADSLFEPDENVAGPTAVGRGEFTHGDYERSAAIVARYCDRASDGPVRIMVTSGHSRTAYTVEPLSQGELKAVIV